jgi:hypothetical protein
VRFLRIALGDLVRIRALGARSVSRKEPIRARGHPIAAGGASGPVLASVCRLAPRPVLLFELCHLMKGSLAGYSRLDR